MTINRLISILGGGVAEDATAALAAANEADDTADAAQAAADEADDTADAAQATASTALANAATALAAANEADDTADAAQATASTALANAATAQATANAAVPVARVLTATSPLQVDGGSSSDLSANRTFSVLPVSNTTPGVAPQHAGAADVGKALIATATASAWGAVVPATRTLIGTSPIQIDSVNTSLDLSANRTISVLAVGNANPGVAPQHAGAADVGKALIATATASAWGTDFGAQTLTTTGNLKLGTNPASAGAARFANAGIVSWRNAANSGDVDAIQVTSGNIVAVGSVNFQTTVFAANSLTFQTVGAHTLTYSSIGTNTLLFNPQSVSVTFGMAASSTALAFTGKGQDNNSTGGTGGAVLWRAGDATGASGTRTGGACDIRPGSGASAGGLLRLLRGDGTARLSVNDTGVGFFTTAPVAQQNITGSRGGNAALADLLTKLASTGLITDGTSA
jgi:hypothetical protein